ncbi:sulfatase [Brachybacterium sp. NPDC056505]|uniref:sulfatase family protein n=1 Tax=Brachybacterium sp. NPDC056505 TaxID=3345843 RepID=UPI003672A489
MRPNIIYLNSHDTGRWISPYGYAAPTPRMQRFAEQGIVFRHAFSASPTCSPSRAALLTGRWPHEVGMLGLSHRGFSLTDPTEHLSHVLGRSGYRTALAGVQHVSEDPALLGFDEILPVDSHSAVDVGPVAAQFVSGEHEEPFYLEIGFIETHRRYPEPGPQDDARYLRAPAHLPDSPETREDMAGYSASVRRLDDAVGAVLDAVDRAGIADHTLVVCTTDHGPAFPGMKCTLTDGGLGVMLMMRGPGIRSGTVSDALVSQLDLFPTLCEFAEVPAPEGLRGTSLAPVLEDEEATLHDAVHAELTYHVDYEPQRSVRTERFAYVRAFRALEHRILEHTDAGPSKEYLVERGWGDRAPEREMLFDLQLDPGESRNLVDDPAYGDVLVEMRARLESWMRETDDPLARGPIPPPAGANVLGGPPRTE